MHNNKVHDQIQYIIVLSLSLFHKHYNLQAPLIWLLQCYVLP